jgi:hypothetical protein
MVGENSTTTTRDYWKTTDRLGVLRPISLRNLPFFVPMPGLAHRDDGPVQALVVVGAGAGTAGLDRQAGLRAVEGLDLALRVAASQRRS